VGVNGNAEVSGECAGGLAFRLSRAYAEQDLNSVVVVGCEQNFARIVVG